MSGRRSRQEVVSEDCDGEGRAESRLIPVSAWATSMKPFASPQPQPETGAASPSPPEVAWSGTHPVPAPIIYSVTISRAT